MDGFTGQNELTFVREMNVYHSFLCIVSSDMLINVFAVFSLRAEVRAWNLL